MKILLIHPNDLLTTPTTVRVLRFAQELTKRGHTCSIAFFVEQGRRDEGFQTGYLEDLKKAGIAYHELKPFSPIQNTMRIRNLAKKADIVHIQKAIPYSTLPAITGAQLAGKPIHYDWDDHETELARLIHRKKYYPQLIHQYESKMVALSTTLTYSSEALLQEALKLGQSKERCFWLPVGADFEELNLPSNREEILKLHGFESSSKILMYAGHLEAGSGAKLFIESFRLAFQKNPSLRGIVLGGGTHFEEYKKWVGEIGLGSVLKFTNYVTRKKVIEYIHMADINVISLENTLYNRCKSPLKLLEAMSTGKMLLATDVGEIPKIVDDSSLLANANPESLAEKIIEISMLSHERAFEVGKKLQKRVRNDFSWYHCSLRLEKAYEKCLENRS